MTTRGSLQIGKRFYYIRSDAYESFALPTLKKALQIMKKPTHKEFIRAANKIAGVRWINGRASKDFLGSIFDEYRWKVDLKNKTVRDVRPTKVK